MDTFIDPQIIGARSDGTECGVVRVEPVRGNYVLMPWRPAYLTITKNGTATCAIGSGSTNNSDGSSTRLSVSVASDAGYANSVIVQQRFTGNVFGLRYETLPGPIGCMIDGVAYVVPLNPAVDPRTGFSSALFPASAYYYLLADDLGPGIHVAELVFPAFTSGSTRQYLVHGYVVDGKAGATPPAPSSFVQVNQAPVTITATTGPTAQSLANASATTANSFWGFRKILFFNSSVSAVTITAVYSTRNTTPIWQKSISPGDTVELDWCGIIGDVNNLQFYASAGSVVFATPIGV